MQYEIPEVNVLTHSGADFIAFFNAWVGAVESTHAGTSRPDYANSGMIWVDTSSPGLDAIKYFDGTQDHPLFDIDTTGAPAPDLAEFFENELGA